MSRAVANDRDSVAPFEHVAVAAERATWTIRDAVAAYRNSDRFAREAIEGGPIDLPEVPGAAA